MVLVQLTLMRDTIQVLSMSVASGQTTLTDTNLLPGHIYNYTASLNGNLTAHTQATTMDTSSHSFLWQTFTLGDGSGSSALYDVAIINDSLAYACGEIYYGSSICNLARWNGQQWDTMHISVTLTYTNSQIVTDQDPLNTIYAFNENDIWVVSQSGGVSHWNGTQCVMLSIPFNQGPGACNKMWGTSSSDLYFVGNDGRIIHYNGSSWTRIESGTTLDFQDIYGAINSQTNQLEILAVASQLDINQGNKIVSIQGTTVVPINSSGLSWSIVGVWFLPGKQYYIVGDGVGQKHSLQDVNPWTVHPTGTLARNYSTSVRGNNSNDVVIVGAYGDMIHYNGLTWKDYFDQTSLPIGSFTSVAVKGNLVIAVGGNSPKAAITMGRRQQ